MTVLDSSAHVVTALHSGWHVCTVKADAALTPNAVEQQAEAWVEARVPGTAAQVLGQHALLHDRDVWFRCRFPGTPSASSVLKLDGLLTHGEVWLNGAQLLQFDNAFVGHRARVSLLKDNALYIRHRALAPLLLEKRGRARWKPRMMSSQGLRHVRTTVLGHMPGWCPPVDLVGPYRAVSVESGPYEVRHAAVSTELRGNTGVVSVGVRLIGTAPEAAVAHVGSATAALKVEASDGGVLITGEVSLENPALWWPHTHGTPALHPVSVVVGKDTLKLGQVGFRRIEADRSDDGFGLRVNGVPVFARGAVWTSADLVSLEGRREALLPLLARAKAAGMNMLRVGGTFLYESDEFYGLCDELGILVWQDFAFANFDYPTQDEAFMASAKSEVSHFLERTLHRPSLAVLCGGSEVAQSAAMLGQPRSAWSSALFDEVIPKLASELRPDVPYVPGSPSGGPLPFSPNASVTHYYGVGAYLRPLEDARRADVRFAAESLAFSNVPSAANLSSFLKSSDAPVHHPKWKERVPRDVGASWDFEDVRDFYLREVYREDPLVLRATDLPRYLSLSRAVTGEVMAATFAEWRRARSTCRGALVWFLKDLWAGAGWGVLDSSGQPKLAWHALARAFSPQAVFFSDEGLNGLYLHVLNERPTALDGTVHVAFFKHGETLVERVDVPVSLLAHGTFETSLASCLPQFFDTTYAYRFGPAPFDVAWAELRRRDGTAVHDAFYFPQGQALPRRTDLGLTVRVERGDEATFATVSTRAFAQGVTFDVDGYHASEEGFHLAPGQSRRVELIGARQGSAPDGEVHAINGLSPTRLKG